MTMRLSAQRVLDAFVARSQHHETHVVFGKRGSDAGNDGYVRVWGPSADLTNQHQANETCHINIECRYDGVSVSEQLAKALGPKAQQRKRDHSAGPILGRFKWELVPDPNASPDAIVDSLIGAFKKAGLTW